MKLNIATCQMPTDINIDNNLEQVLQLMRQARAQGADVAHFPECALSGYAGIDFESFDGFDWIRLKQASEQVLALAAELKLWVILGSSHPLSDNNKPHNSLYIINSDGKIHDRYDKLFCAGDKSGEVGDLKHYSPGNHFCVFEINGVTCGALICHDYRYPELYREYKKKGVQVMFHSYHAGHINPDFYRFMQEQVGFENHQHNIANTIPGITQPAAMIASSSNNYMWISCPNSAAKNSCWASFFIRPDGVMTGCVPLHEPGILLSTVDTEAEYYDSTVAWRDRLIHDGVFHSGEIVEDQRSNNRSVL